MKSTVPAKVSKRKAKDERLLDFDGLADFANLGDKPSDWESFQVKCGHFFPADMKEWIYSNAKAWWKLSNFPDTRPDDWREFLRGLPGFQNAKTIENWAKVARDFRMEMRTFRPPLLIYRNLLRRVWRRKDPHGHCLRVLLGFDSAWAPILEKGEIKVRKEFEEEGPLDVEESGIDLPLDYGSVFDWKAPEMPKQHTIQSPFGPVTWKDKKTVTEYRLPLGNPVIDGNTGTIGWEFGCQFQTSIYELMQERRRGRGRERVCKWGLCKKKYFVADKMTRKYCSPNCCGERRREQCRKYQEGVGTPRRRELKATRTTAHRRKS